MLQGLDDIDWSRLRHAYGPAEDVPGLIRDLTSPADSVRQNAFYELFGNIWHQGTVYEATTAAVPFLIELLQSPTAFDRQQLALLVASIASGHGYLEVHARPEWFEADWRKILRKQGKTLENELEREHSVTASVRHAAQAALPLLIPFLTDPEPDLRTAVAEALASYPEHREAHLILLEQALSNESDENARQIIQGCITHLKSAS